VVDVLLLLPFWSSKEFDLILAAPKTLLLCGITSNCFFSFACNPTACQVDPNANPSGTSKVDPNVISLPPPPIHFFVPQGNQSYELRFSNQFVESTDRVLQLQILL
jgi:hypothetical protein